MQRAKGPRKNCPYTVTITCDLTPPYDFIRETRHTTREIALRHARKAKQEFRGTPGLKIVVKSDAQDKPRRTSWERILKV